MLTTQVNPFPQEIWNQILIYCDANHLANLRISNMFFSIVETSSKFILTTHFKLDRQENGNFRRIVYLESLIRQLTKKEYVNPVLRNNQGFHRTRCLEMGINPYNYRTPPLGSTDPEDLKLEKEKQAFFHSIKKSINRECQAWLPSSLSIQNFLEIAKIFINQNDYTQGAIRQIALMTPHIFCDHPAKKDLYDLINRNVDDSLLSLSYDPIKAKQLLKANFLELNDEIVYAIYFYLLELDIEGLIFLLTLIQEKKWLPSRIWEALIPGFNNILTTSIENKTEVFVNFLNLFAKYINSTTDKIVLGCHVAEKGQTEIFKKLITGGTIDVCCYHYAKNAEIANILFEKMKKDNGIDLPLLNDKSRSPLLTAILKDNHEVAAWLINKGALLYDNWENYMKTRVDLQKPLLEYTRNLTSFQLLTKAAKTSTLAKFLFLTKLKNFCEEKIFKWIALKELAYRAIRITAIVLLYIAACAAVLAIIRITCPTLISTHAHHRLL